MVRSFRWFTLAPICFAAACSGAPAPSAPHDNIQIHAGSATQVTADRSNRLQWEFTICADPNNPNELAAGSVYERAENRYYHDTAFYTSHDGGKSWKLSLDSRHQVDPACAFANDGTLYAADMTFGQGLDYRGFALFTSHNRGNTWTRATWGTNAENKHPYTHLDREWLAVDLSHGKYGGTAYFNGIQYYSDINPDGSEIPFAGPAKIFLFRSSDGGKSIIASTPRGSPKGVVPNAFGTHPGQVAVLSDGTVVHAFFSFDGYYYLARSTDGGRTIEPYQKIGGTGKTSMHDDPHLAQTIGERYHWIPFVDVDRSNGPYRDRVYVIWTEASSGRVQVWGTHSLDRHARVWAPATPIDDTQAFDNTKVWRGPNDVNPAVAVNKNGVVGILWADRRDTGARGYWPRFAASLDGGLTWSHSVHASDRPGRWTTAQSDSPDVTDGNYVAPLKDRPLTMQITHKAWAPLTEPGDHWGMAADAAGIFHPVWSDDRTGIQQVWTAPITVDGTLRTATEVTDQVSVSFLKHNYDPDSRLATADVVVTNISNRPIPGTLILKSADPAEFVAFNKPNRENNLRALNADNGWEGPGAYWTLQPAGKSDQLLPGASTAPTHLEFLSRTKEEPDGSLGVRVYSEMP